MKKLLLAFAIGFAVVSAVIGVHQSPAVADCGSCD